MALGLFVVLQWMLYALVIMQGDDFWYASSVAQGIPGFLRFLARHYVRANGRLLVHALAGLFFWDGTMIIWKIITPIFIAGVFVLIAKCFTGTKRQFQVMLAALCLLYLSLGGEVVAYGPLSVTTSANYLFPALIVYLDVILLLRMDSTGKPKGLLLLTGFLAGATMEQWGMIVLGYAVLLPLSRWIAEKKKPRLFAIAHITAVALGLLTVVLAPGNFVRMGSSVRPLPENFVAATTMLMNIPALWLFQLLLTAALCYWLFTLQVKKGLRALHTIQALLLILGWGFNFCCMFRLFGLDFERPGLVHSLFQIYDLFYLASLCYVPLAIWLKKKNPMYLVQMIIGLGALYMLIAASVSPYRPLLPTLFVEFVFIGLTALDWFAREKKTKFSLFAAISAVFAFTVFGMNFSGFYQNARAENINLARIDEYRKAGKLEEELVLLAVPRLDTAGYLCNLLEKDSFDLQLAYLRAYQGAHGIEDASIRFVSELFEEE